MCSLQLPILLKFTSGPNAYNKEGRTPMLCAIANHYSIKELIEGSADINFPSRKKEDDSSTSLLLAARVKLTLRLLQNLQNGRDEAFSKLNIDNRKLLWHGTKLENVIGILSQELRVAPINAQLPSSKTGPVILLSLLFSKVQKFLSVSDVMGQVSQPYILLEDLNCDPNAVEKCEDSTSLDTWNNSLHILASRGIFYALCRETSSFQPCSPILQGDLGIEGGADINLPSRKKEDDSSTSLLLAARVKHTLRLLQNLQNGRDEAFSKLNIDNRKLLWYGTKLENVIGILSQELRILLEDLNCDPNAVEKSEDSTSLDTWNNSLHILASRGIFYALPILLKFKSDPNAYNKEGRTPMLCAIANHYSIKELIEGGADINLPSRKKEDDSSTSLLLTARVKHTLRLLQNLQNGRNKAFSKLNIDNRKLLWHGTKLENVIGILSQELRVAPINAQL
ncbi:Poly [ADP-ribose] polymerase 2 [Nymphon striatum]|nr:Poly [ADP-ribose] polymerase 2 [Nymphon striatum]